MQHFKNIYRAKDLKCCKKFALYYWLPWRWLMLTTSAINAFVTPLVTMCVPPENFGWPVRRPPHRTAPPGGVDAPLSLFRAEAPSRRACQHATPPLVAAHAHAAAVWLLYPTHPRTRTPPSADRRRLPSRRRCVS